MSIITTLIIHDHITDEQIKKFITRCNKYNLITNTIGDHKLTLFGNINQITQIYNQYKSYIKHIIGLNKSKDLHTYLKFDSVKSNVLIPFTPLQLAEIYNFPTGLNGAGQTIGIVQFGGGYQMSDVNTYLTNLGIDPSVVNITDVSVDGGQNSFLPLNPANVEVILDLEVIVALVPNANIRIYFAPNSLASFYNSIFAAINDGCKIISVSWGLYENGWGSSNLIAMNNLFQYAAEQNVTITVAAGDRGSSDGAPGDNVDFPGSSVYSLCCGGSTLDATNNVRVSEVVWNNNPTTSASGGGISSFFSKPSYQNNVSFDLGGLRGVPDVSGNADPNSGYTIYYNSQYITVGGTSATAPLYAGLIARINQYKSEPVGFINQIIYDNPNVFYDITSGNNGSFTAALAWDACSGMGVCNGQLLMNLLSPSEPISAFTYSPTSGNIPLLVNFTNISVNATNYLWDFGDGSTSTETNPSHTFTTVNTFNITLTATNSIGSNNTVQQITTTPSIILPVASFTYVPISGEIPLLVNFTNTSTNSLTYLWDFGDGDTSTDINPSHTFTTSNIFNVTLTAINNDGSNNIIQQVIAIEPVFPVASFNFSPSTGHAPLTVNFTSTSTNTLSYYWDFGDGNTSLDANPIHTYTTANTFNVMLTAINNNGSDMVTKLIIVLPPIPLPVASFTFDPITGISPLNVDFNNTSIDASDYIWDFGDGNTSLLVNPSHIYDNVGTFTIILTANNNNGSNSISQQIVVDSDVLPVASFNLQGNDIGKAPFYTQFINNSIKGATYLWDFGDGNTSTEQNPNHVYVNHGNYVVTLLTSNNIGIDNYSITIKVIPGTLKANYKAHIDKTNKHIVKFKNISIGATEYKWYFGDGTTSESKDPNHTYNEKGEYYITLISSSYDITDAITKIVKI